MTQLLFRLYHSLWFAKHQLLVSVFGFSSYCKHTPTCSEYWAQQTRSHGTIVGSWRGLLRLLTCW